MIPAIGELLDPSILLKGIEVNRQNVIAVDPTTPETSLHGIFAGGDAVLVPATIIEAIVAGRRTALSIDDYLRGRG